MNRFVSEIRLEQSRTEQLHCELSTGGTLYRKPKDTRWTLKIKNMVKNYNKYTILEFLEAMSLNMGSERTSD